MLGEFNPQTAAMMGNLGLTYQKVGNLAEAEEMFNNSMEVLVAIQGPEDDGVATIHNRLAVLYKNNLEDFGCRFPQRPQGCDVFNPYFGKAEEHFTQSIKIWKKLFGPAYSQLQFCYDALIWLFKKTGEEAKRREYEEKKNEWMKLQKEEKDKKEKKEEKKEDKKMGFNEMVEFVKNT